MMIPGGGDHSTRSLLHRRVSSWAEAVSVVNPEELSVVSLGSNNNNNNNNNQDETATRTTTPSNSFNFDSSQRQQLQRRSRTNSIMEEHDDGEDENNNDPLSQPLLVSLLPDLEYEEASARSNADDDIFSIATLRRRKGFKLWFVFLIMILSGVSTVVLAKLQSLPMYNYPTLLNLYANFMYIIVSFAYIIPVATFGWFHNTIPRPHLWWKLPKKPFLVMGFLDALGAALQILASVYLPGTLLVLLPQASIPLSMITSKYILREKFTRRQYVGAAVVFLGILVVLFPVLTHQRHHGFNNNNGAGAGGWWSSGGNDDDDGNGSEDPNDYYSCQPIHTKNNPSSGGVYGGEEEEHCALCQMETTKEDCLSHTTANEENDAKNLNIMRFLFAADDDMSSSSNNNNNNNNNNHNSNSTIQYYCQWISRTDYYNQDYYHSTFRKEDLLVFVWSLVMVASCVPMVLSSVYKQVALQVQLDPILVNGWVSIFQFLFGLPLTIPSGLVSSPIVKPWELGQNWFHGLSCLFAKMNFVESGCHPDDCSQAALWVHLFLLSSIIFTLSIMFVLKYGSSSLLYLGLTLMVPLTHLVFSLHDPMTIGIFDVIGLLVLVSGLVLYRFGNDKGQEDELLQQQQQGTAAAATTTAGDNTNNQTTNDNNNNSNNEKDGFLEFLREPFMLMGDI